MLITHWHNIRIPTLIAEIVFTIFTLKFFNLLFSKHLFPLFARQAHAVSFYKLLINHRTMAVSVTTAKVKTRI